MKRYFILCLFSFLCLSAMADDQSAALNQGEKGQIVPDASLLIKDTEQQDAITTPTPKEKKLFHFIRAKKVKGCELPVLNSPAPEEKGEIVPARIPEAKRDTEQNLTQPIPIHNSRAFPAKKDDAQEPALNNPISGEKGIIVPARTREGKREAELNSTEPLPIHSSEVLPAKKDDSQEPALNNPISSEKGIIVPDRTQAAKRDLEQNLTQPIPIHGAQAFPAKKDSEEVPILNNSVPEEKGEFVRNETLKLKDIDKPDSALNTPAPEGKGIIVPFHSIKGKTDN